jgi:hypothetical protein
MRTMIALGPMALALSGMAQSEPTVPDARHMASVAYRVPVTRIDAAVASMRRDFRVANADIPQALGVLAHCGKTGSMEFGDLVDGIATVGPGWNATMHHDGTERAFGIRRNGLEDVQRLCRTFEVARRGHGSSADTIDSVREVLTSRDQTAVVARTMIGNLGIEEVDGSRGIRDDYRLRMEEHS